MNEDLRNWFSKSHPEGNWKRYNTKGEAIGPCAREPGEPKPKCLSNEKAAKMSKSEIASAVKRKRKKDPVADRPGKGGAPKMVSNKINEVKNDPCWIGYKQVGMKKKGKKMVPNCVKEQSPLVKKILEQLEGERELQKLEEKNVPTNPSLWAKMKSRAKSKFDVYPSAYANGWAAKEYKKAGGGWKSVSEEIELEEAVRIPSKTGNIILVTLTWRGKYYAMKMFFPQVSVPNRRAVQDQINKVYPGSRVLAYNISEIKPGEQFLQTEDWQKVNRKDKTDGLSQKAVNAYRRENPGSKLQTAVTEKNPKGKRADRRKSFCSRMKGMKKRLTSAETARDPDSRINKALRRWRCN